MLRKAKWCPEIRGTLVLPLSHGIPPGGVSGQKRWACALDFVFELGMGRVMKGSQAGLNIELQVNLMAVSTGQGDGILVRGHTYTGTSVCKARPMNDQQNPEEFLAAGGKCARRTVGVR